MTGEEKKIFTAVIKEQAQLLAVAAKADSREYIYRLEKHIQDSDKNFERLSIERIQAVDELKILIQDINHAISETNTRVSTLCKKVTPIYDSWKALLLSRSFIVGIASVVVALGVIGTGILWVIRVALDK